MWRLIRAHRGEGCDVVLHARDEEGCCKESFTFSFTPYFYILDNASLSHKEVVGFKHGYRSLYDDELKMVIVRNPSDVPSVRSTVEKHFEADIPFARRFLIDKGIESGFDFVGDNVIPTGRCDAPLHAGFLDIEVLSYGDVMPNPANDPISCVCIGSKGEYASFILDDVDISMEYDEHWAIVHLDSEEKLLRAVCEALRTQNYDILMCWNAPFDIEYLEKRCAQYSINLPLDGTFDLLQAYRHLYRRKSYRLKDIAIVEGITQEEEQRVNYGKMWEDDRVGLIWRNRRHTEWCYGIDKKLSISSYWWELKETSGLDSLKDVFYNSVLIDTMLLRRSAWILPSKEAKKHEPYEGAYVMSPPAGVIENVAVFDLSRFYPSILLHERLDPRILHLYHAQNGEIDWAKYRQFAQGKPSLLLNLVEEMVEERKKLQASGHKDKLASIKAVLNSTYGVLGSPHFRLYMREIPERVTAVARETIVGLRDTIEKWGHKVIYADSVTGNTETYIFSRRGSLRKEAIAHLFHRYSKNVTHRSDGKEEIDIRGKNLLTFALSLDETVTLSRIVRIVRHRVNTDRLLTVVTQSGKHVTTTPNHSLLCSTKQGIKICDAIDADTDTLLLGLAHEDRPDMSILRRKVQGTDPYSPEATRSNTLRPKRIGISDVRSNTTRSARESSTGPSWEKTPSNYQAETSDFPPRQTAMEQGKGRSVDDGSYGRREVQSLAAEKVRFYQSIPPSTSRGRSCWSSERTADKYFPQRNDPTGEDNVLSPQDKHSSQGRATVLGISQPHRHCGPSKGKENSVFGSVRGWVLLPLLPNPCSQSDHEDAEIKPGERQASRDSISQERNPGYPDMGMPDISGTIGCSGKSPVGTTLERISSINPYESPFTTTYVYDLEVEGTHNFLANGLFVHNTDSCYCVVNRDDVDDLETRINEFLPDDYSVKLEHYFLSVLFTGAKKRYCGMEEGSGTLYFAGFEQVRSDSSNYTKEIQERVMRMLLENRTEDILPYLEQKTRDVVRCPIKDIAITKTLSRDLAGYGKQQQNYIKAAKEARWLRNVVAGDSVQIVPARNYPHGVAVFQDETDLPKEVQVDWGEVVRTQIERKVKDLLPFVGLNFSEVKGQGRLL